MPVVWSIKADGGHKTCEAWGLGNLTRRRVSQGVDVASCVAAGSSVGSLPLFALDSGVTIYRDSAIWFSGRVTRVPHSGSPAEESVSYEFSGPWWYLDNKLYQQTWKLWDTSSAALTDQYKSRIILGQSSAGERQTVAQIITEILNYAIGDGVPIAIGTITPLLQIPFDERVDISCGEAIRTVLRWIPDAVCWFDYSTVTPRFNCKRRSELTAVQVDLNQGAPNHGIEIAPRPDLQVSAVVLKFEQTHEVDEQSYESVTIDKAPSTATGRELRALVDTIQLAGSRLTMQRQTIETEALPAYPYEDLAWWKARVPFLNDPLIGSINIHDVVRGIGGVFEEGHEYWDNELMSGSIQDWMTEEAEEDQLTAYVDFITLVEEEGDVHEVVVNKVITYKFVATSLTSGTYKRVDELTTGESVPLGMAAEIYAGLSVMQYEGQFVLLEDEITGSVGLGNVINVAHGLAEWASMRGCVQSILEDVDNGLTTIEFGFPTQLGPGDLLELLRANRSRRVSISYKARVSGDPLDAGGSVDAENLDVLKDASSGGGEKTKTIYRDPDAPADTISIDPSQITQAGAVIQPRQAYILSADAASLKKREVMCSDAFGDEKLTQITVITALQYDTSSHQLQIKTRTIRAIDVGSESEFTMITGGQAAVCP